MDPSGRRRALVLGVCFLGLFSALIVRLYAVQIRDHEESLRRQTVQSAAQVTVQTPRSAIYDRNGHVLAVSVPVQSVWANPSAIPDWPAASKLLSRALQLPEDEVAQQLLRDNREWVWIKRKVNDEEAAAVRKLCESAPFRVEKKSREPKLGLATEYVRRYPFGRDAAQVIGIMVLTILFGLLLDRFVFGLIQRRIRVIWGLEQSQ